MYIYVYMHSYNKLRNLWARKRNLANGPVLTFKDAFVPQINASWIQFYEKLCGKVFFLLLRIRMICVQNISYKSSTDWIDDNKQRTLNEAIGLKLQSF